MREIDISKWLEDHPNITSFQAAGCDINGIWRGKRVPIEQVEKILNGQMRMPLSAFGLDVWGRDIEDSPLVFESGDSDGICHPTERGMLPFVLDENPTVMIPVWMMTEKGEPSPVDPRRILASAVERAHKAGFYPVMALEMEFYLVDASGDQLRSPVSPLTHKRTHADAVLSIDELDQFERFFDQVYEVCRQQGIAVDAAISEGGQGQFEINLLHCDDPLRSADDAALFKHVVKKIARRYNMAASFMAKPFVDRAGSGMHVDFSLLDKKGANVFDDGSVKGSDILRHAVGGVLDTMVENALIWAPHLNSYRRLQPSNHAPTGVCWGYENRTAAVRIPGGSPKARRIEHRIAGADTNPYLVLAAIIHGALDGIENKTEPAAPITGDAYSMKDLECIPEHWIDAIRGFEESDFASKNFSKMFHDVYTKTKRQEYDKFNAAISNFEVKSYLESV